MDAQEIERQLIDGNFLRPELCGKKHVIYSKVFEHDLITEVMFPSLPGVKLWPGGLTQLYQCIDEWTGRRQLFCFGVMEVDCAYNYVVWPHEVTRPFRELRRLAFLQSIYNSDDYIVQVCIVAPRVEWIIVFECRRGLEIAFYGGETEWSALRAKLESSPVTEPSAHV